MNVQYGEFAGLTRKALIARAVERGFDKDKFKGIKRDKIEVMLVDKINEAEEPAAVAEEPVAIAETEAAPAADDFAALVSAAAGRNKKATKAKKAKTRRLGERPWALMYRRLLESPATLDELSEIEAADVNKAAAMVERSVGIRLDETRKVLEALGLGTLRRVGKTYHLELNAHLTVTDKNGKVLSDINEVAASATGLVIGKGYTGE